MKPTSARLIWIEGSRRLHGFDRPLAFAWFANAALALLVGLPIYAAFDEQLARSRYAAAAARGLDLDWFLEFKAATSDVFDRMNAPMLVAAALMLILSVFMAGGMLGRLRAGERPARMSAFLADGASHFARFMRLFLWSVVLSALVFWFVGVQLSAWLEEALVFQQSDLVAVGARLVLWAAVLWLLAWIHMAQDLGRLAAVVRGSRAMTFEFARGLAVSFRRFEVLSRLYLWTLLGWLVVTAGYLFVSRMAWLVPGAWGALAIVLVAQAYMVARIWIGMGLTAALLTWYEGQQQANPQAS